MTPSPPSPASSRDRVEEGTAAFNRGDYFLAHELWEEVWRELPRRSQPETWQGNAAGGGAGAPNSTDHPAPTNRAHQAILIQGLIQIAAGCHHLRNQRCRPAMRLLEKGLAKLSTASRDLGSPPGLVDANRVRIFTAAVNALLGTLAASCPAPAEALPDPGALKL